MTTPDSAVLETVTQLLLYEGGGQDQPEPAARAATAGRVYDKIIMHIGPIVGQVGVEVLFARSLRLASAAHPFLSASAPRGGLIEDREAAVTLYATFFGLLSAIIGAGLVAQLLRDAWPQLDWPLFDKRNG